MKSEIHPAYHDTSAVTCACGAVFTVGSTLPKIQIEICSSCHPFFSGQEKVLDTAGRVERFKKRTVKSAGLSVVKKDKKPRAKSNQKTTNGLVSLSG